MESKGSTVETVSFFSLSLSLSEAASILIILIAKESSNSVERISVIAWQEAIRCQDKVLSRLRSACNREGALVSVSNDDLAREKATP